MKQASQKKDKPWMDLDVLARKKRHQRAIKKLEDSKGQQKYIRSLLSKKWSS
jgi:hypothetical protein